MSKEPYIIAIDIGSNSVKLAIAKDNLDENGKMQILALIEKTSHGIRRGLITSMQEASSSVIDAVVQAESVIGLPIKRAVFGINGVYVSFVNSDGLVVVSRSDNEITESDVDRVIGDALSKAFGLNNQEILHVLPKSFLVDTQAGIRYPVGMIGSKLQAKTLIIGVESSYLRNFNKVVTQSGLEITDNVYSPLASSEFVLSSRQKKAGTVMIDIGFSSTSYIVCENEEIYASGVVPIGSDHITNDLALGLSTTIEMAEDIKRQYLDLSSDYDETVTEIEMYNPETHSNEHFLMSLIRNFAKARVEEIFMLIKQELKKIDRLSKLPGGLVMIGGGANLKGIDEVAREVLKLPIFKYQFDRTKVDFIPDYNGDPTFINAIALLSYSINHLEDTKTKKATFTSSSQVSNNQSGNYQLDLGKVIKKIWPW
jgi:cell division protein FtsA